jgi:hypothetical protein
MIFIDKNAADFELANISQDINFYTGFFLSINDIMIN